VDVCAGWAAGYGVVAGVGGSNVNRGGVGVGATSTAVVGAGVAGGRGAVVVACGRGAVVVCGGCGSCHGWPRSGLPRSSAGVQYAPADPSRIGVQNMYQPPAGAAGNREAVAALAVVAMTTIAVAASTPDADRTTARRDRRTSSPMLGS
jgi:hypothetical protein